MNRAAGANTAATSIPKMMIKMKMKMEREKENKSIQSWP